MAAGQAHQGVTAPGGRVPPESRPWRDQPPAGAGPQTSEAAVGGRRAETRPGIKIPEGNPPLALDGYCPVQLREKERWVQGNPRWGARHEGRTYLFAGPEEQAKFLENPSFYAPAISGNDVVLAVDHGQMVAGDRRYGGWFRGQMYLFSSETSFQRFEVDPHRYAAAVESSARAVATRGRPPAGSRGGDPQNRPDYRRY